MIIGVLSPLQEFLEWGLERGGGVGGMVSVENTSLEQELRLFLRDPRLLRRERAGGVGLSTLATDCRD